jgi:hypothetical protein
MRARSVVLLPLMLASFAGADDEAEQRLRRYFEGHPVVVLIDMPASQAGVDVYPEREYPLEYAKVSDRIGSSSVSVRRGDRIAITRVKLKDDLIEFQLGGGGFSNFRHGSGTVSYPSAPKSSRERDLERQLRNETDEARRRDIRRELDYLRREREYRDRQNREIAEIANEQRRERDYQRSLDLGSRFNVRFEKKDVPELYKAPEGLMRALEKYVDFLSLGPPRPERPEDLVADAPRKWPRWVPRRA